MTNALLISPNVPFLGTERHQQADIAYNGFWLYEAYKSPISFLNFTFIILSRIPNSVLLLSLPPVAR